MRYLFSLLFLSLLCWGIALPSDALQQGFMFWRNQGILLSGVLVKGGDYKPEEIAGYAEVTANGGEVRVLHFEDGCSTSNIVKTIIERECK